MVMGEKPRTYVRDFEVLKAVWRTDMWRLVLRKGGTDVSEESASNIIMVEKINYVQSSILKIDIVRSSETSVNTDQTTVAVLFLTFVITTHFLAVGAWECIFMPRLYIYIYIYCIT
jgi:hypothetical protein